MHRNSASVVAVFTIVLALVGIFQGLIYTGQLFSMRESTYVSRKLWETEHRPYVTIDKVEVFDPNDTPANKASGREPQPWHSVAASISYKNAGGSPAQNMTFHRHIVFDSSNSDSGIPDFFVDTVTRKEAESNPKRMGQSLNVGEARETTAFAMLNSSDEPDFFINPGAEREWDGKSPIIIFGRISYQDRFGNRYCTPIFMDKYPGADVNFLDKVKSNGRFYMADDLCPDELTKDAQNEHPPGEGWWVEPLRWLHLW